MAKVGRVSASWWRVLLVNLAFSWHMVRPRLSAYAWRMSRFLATEKTHMALAAYCSGVMMNKRILGEYEDPAPTTYDTVSRTDDVN